MGTKILLTGSSGWLGRFLAPKLREHGHQVIGLDVVKGEHTSIQGSVCDKGLIERIFPEHGIEATIHCGALHKPDIARYPASAFVDVNIKGTLHLPEASVSAGHDRFLFTSTTSVMISREVRSGCQDEAFWLDEAFGPLLPRNIYSVTKLAAEDLCRLYSENYGIDVAILRTARFFPEEDDTLTFPDGPNLKANEFLNRRLAVEDAADAHVVALDGIKGRGCREYILSAPTPFCQEDCRSLVSDAPGVIAKYFPQAREIYDRNGWYLPEKIERVYDSSLADRELGFRPRVDYQAILDALESGDSLPFHHDPDYISPKETQSRK